MLFAGGFRNELGVAIDLICNFFVRLNYQIPFLEADVAWFGAAHGELTQRAQVALVCRWARRTHRTALHRTVVGFI